MTAPFGTALALIGHAQTYRAGRFESTIDPHWNRHELGHRCASRRGQPLPSGHSSTYEPAVLNVQLGRPNEILKRCRNFAHDNNWDADTRSRSTLKRCLARALFSRTKPMQETESKRPNREPGEFFPLARISPQEQEHLTLPEKGTNSNHPLDRKGHKDVRQLLGSYWSPLTALSGKRVAFVI